MLTLALSIFSVLLDLTFLSALAEQIIWDGQHFTFLLVAIVSAALFGTWCAVGKYLQSQRYLPARPSLIFVLGSIVLLTWWWGISFDLWSYCQGTSRECSVIGPPEWLALALLIFLTIISSANYLKSAIDSVLVRMIGLAALIFIFRAIIQNPKLMLLGGLREQENFVTLAISISLIAFRLITARFCGNAKDLVPRIFAWGQRAIALTIVLSLALFAFTSLESIQGTLRSIPPSFKVSSRLILPLLAAEDPIFLRHHGLDWKRQQDAIREAFDHEQLGRGGSTITMQLAKLKYVGWQKTVLRKVKQIVSAIAIELLYSKEQILYNYLESIPFAPGVVGISKACEIYFHTSPQLLSDDQALKLVVSIYDPTLYNPGLASMPTPVLHRAIAIKGRTQAIRQALSSELSSISIINTSL